MNRLYANRLSVQIDFFQELKIEWQILSLNQYHSFKQKANLHQRLLEASNAQPSLSSF